MIAGLADVLAGVGVIQALAGWRLVARFAGHVPATDAAATRPPVTVLKPLHGDEPLLDDALGSLCRQDYPDFQIVCGVQSEADPAAAAVRRLQDRFPACDIALVVDATLHGPNRKIGNLINMLPAARHDILVIADSDVHARPDYLLRLVTALAQPGVGLVTTLYAGLPASRSRIGRLAATQITHGFLPGAVLARALGRQDCLGATMCLRRTALERIGGLRALLPHLADDQVLGRRIAALGLLVVLADTIVLTTVPETRFATLWRHELRWARTIRTLEPLGFAAGVLQYPLFWAFLAVLLSGCALWSIGLFGIVWVLRSVAALGVDAALAPIWGADDAGTHDAGALAFSCPVWLLPFRELLSVAVMLASYGGRQVDWRGHGLQADTPHKPAPIEGLRTR